MSSRFVTPGFASGSARTASGPVSESVTARATLRRTTSGGSSSRITPPRRPAPRTCSSCGSGPAGPSPAPPAAGVTISGTVNTAPYVVVEADREVAGQLDVLALVVADRAPRRAGRAGCRPPSGPGRCTARPASTAGRCPSPCTGSSGPARRCTPCTRAGRPARGGPARRTAGTASPSGSSPTARNSVVTSAMVSRSTRGSCVVVMRVQVGDAVEAVGRSAWRGDHAAQRAEVVAERQPPGGRDEGEVAVHGELLEVRASGSSTGCRKCSTAARRRPWVEVCVNGGPPRRRATSSG